MAGIHSMQLHLSSQIYACHYSWMLNLRCKEGGTQWDKKTCWNWSNESENGTVSRLVLEDLREWTGVWKYGWECKYAGIHKCISTAITCHNAPCLKKRDQEYIVHNFDKFECTVVIFGKQHGKNAAKLLIQQTSTLSNHWCYFILKRQCILLGHITLITGIAGYSHQIFPWTICPYVHRSVQCIVEKWRIGSGCRLAS